MAKFLDLKMINMRHKEEILGAINDVLESGWYINHDHLENFEHEFAHFCGVDYGIGVGSGLDALTLTLAAWKQMGEISEGDEVIVPANTFIASVLAVENAGLIPVFVDPDPSTYNITAGAINSALTEKTKVIMPVHLYGRMAPMQEISQIASSKKLLVLEDCAQAHGAKLETKYSGAWGDAGAFSFYPGKNLGALGDGGFITTKNRNLAETLYAIRNYGYSERYVCDLPGVNSRLDEIQASILRVKIKYLDKDNQKRRDIASLYNSGIVNENIKLPDNCSSDNHVWHLFVIETDNRNELQSYLSSLEIETSIHYPIPPHKQGALKAYNSLSLPITEGLSKRILSLPIGPTMELEEVHSIIHALNSFVPKNG